MFLKDSLANKCFLNCFCALWFLHLRVWKTFWLYHLMKKLCQCRTLYSLSLLLFSWCTASNRVIIQKPGFNCPSVKQPYGIQSLRIRMPRLFFPCINASRCQMCMAFLLDKYLKLTDFSTSNGSNRCISTLILGCCYCYLMLFTSVFKLYLWAPCPSPWAKPFQG